MVTVELNKTSIIETKSGKVQGYIKNGIQIFKGIPYAEPPLGELRFSPPIEKKPWDDVLDSTKYGPCSFQGYTALEEWFGKLQPESEDCLSINIWTPQADNNKRPVMFWIHGGAFIMGGGKDLLYEGSALAQRGDVVVVTINYRLGAHGYLYIPGVTANVGQLDQILALKWVQDNIKLFGGDPDNVTIFGESAGGYAVVTLAAMPAAKGLFNRIISQSAPFIDPTVNKKFTKSLMRKLKIKGIDIKALREVAPNKIIEAQNKITEVPGDALAFRPLIDGDTLPVHPLKVFQNGDCKDIDFMIGTNLEETRMFTVLDPSFIKMSDTDTENAIFAVFSMGGVDKIEAKTIINTYKKEREGKSSTDLKDLMNAIMTDSMFRIPTIRLLEAQRPHQPNTFNYLFTWPSPGFNGALGACHALEIPFVFGVLDLPEMGNFAGKGQDAEALSEKIMDAWIAFAHTGNPNHKGIPDWPAYDKEKRSTMLIDKEFKVIDDFADKERAAWDGILKI